MAKRQIIAGPDIPSHPQPFPTAVRVGNMVFSSAIGGHDPATRETSTDKPTQIAQAFANVRAILARGGATPGDIAKIVVYLKDKADRELVNAEWVKMFPDADDRPVRHTLSAELPGKLCIQLEFIAVV